MYKTIGIIGGMGPLATVDLFRKIVENTAAETDQEHIHVIIDNNTGIPDRTGALLHGGQDPLPEMKKSAAMLEAQGADCLIMPCNTAHNYYEPIADAVSIPVLNMIDITCRAVRERGISRAGLMATTGTVKTGIYQRYSDKYGIELIQPDGSLQKDMMDLIYGGVKAGKEKYDCTVVLDGVGRMLRGGAETIILGCTELPVAYSMYHWDFPAVDPTYELARAAIVFAAGVERLRD